MTAFEAVFFGVVLFSALAALMQWWYLRAERVARLNRGLREYVSAKCDERPGESLSAVL